jgi:hypothetical protein
MAHKTLMLIGGTDNGDYEWLLSHEGKSSRGRHGIHLRDSAIQPGACHCDYK